MRFLGIFVCLITILEAKLVPTPFFMNLQRVGRDSTLTHFGKKLFHDCYGIAMVKPRGTNSTLLIVSDPDWCRLIYTRVYEQQQDFEYLRQFGGYGTATDKFIVPKGLCIDTTIYSNNSDIYGIYIADSRNNRVSKLKYSIAQDRILVDGILVSGLINPADVACASRSEGGAYIVIAEKDTHRIRLYQRSATGTISLIQIYGNRGSGVGEFFEPQGVAICQATDAQGGYFIYVTDTGNRRVVCLRYKPAEGITWKGGYRTMENAHFLSVTASQYYCVYVTDFIQNKIWVFTPGLGELLYKYGDASLLNGPKDVYIDWDRIGLTERWTATTGLQYFKIVPEIREFYPEPQNFDATEDSVKINFRVDETAHYLTMTVAGRNLFENQYFTPGRYKVYWDGRGADGKVVLPGNYVIRIYCQGQVIATSNVTVKGTIVNAGTLPVDAHWTEEDEPYVLTGSVTVNQRLTIDPGVKIMPVDNFILKTAGGPSGNKIIAHGSAINKILFTPHRKLYPLTDSVPKGFWKGIYFDDNHPYWSDTLLLNHCVIEAAGSDTAAIQARNNDYVIITSCEVRKSSGYGYYESNYRVNSNMQTTIINNSTFEDNDSLPIRVAFSSICEVQDNQYIDNKIAAIEVGASYRRHSGTLINPGLPYWFICNRYGGLQKYFEVQSAGDSCITLTIGPGTRLLFEDSSSLQCSYNFTSYNRGRIIALGNENDSIFFSALDATLGWQGIRVRKCNSLDTSYFEYCALSYGGQKVESGYGYGNIMLKEAPLSIRHCSIKSSKTNGFDYVPTISTLIPEIKDNYFVANDSVPLVIRADWLKRRDTNFFEDNKLNYIHVNGATIDSSCAIADQGVPYVIKGSTVISTENNPVIVHIDSNVIMLFMDGAIDVHLNCGLIANYVTFSNYDMASLGNLVFRSCNGDSTVLRNCTIDHLEHNNNCALWSYSSSPKIVKTKITNCNIGIYFTNVPSLPVIDSCEFYLNQTGIQFTHVESSQPRLRHNTFIGNKCSIKNGSVIVVPADSNWWGDETGPWDPSTKAPDYNPTGRGDSIGDYVKYRPWLTSPVHPAVVTLIQPNGNDTLYCESDYEIKWTMAAKTAGNAVSLRSQDRYTCSIASGSQDSSGAIYRTKMSDESDRYKFNNDSRQVEKGGIGRGILRQELYWTSDFPEGGSRTEALWKFIDTVSVSESSYVWQVPNTVSKKCRIAIKVYYVGGVIGVDVSDANFTILDTVAPQIMVIKPNGNEYFIPLIEDTIKWQAADNYKLDRFNILLSTDGGNNFEMVTENLRAPCSTYLWTPEQRNGYECLIKIEARDSLENYNDDLSDQFFYIPVKSYTSEMTPFNNGSRIKRPASSQHLYLVYTQDNEPCLHGLSGNLEISKGQKGPMTEQSGAGKIYFIQSNDLGKNYQNRIYLGDGYYPSLAINEAGSPIIVAWTSRDRTRIYYRYRGKVWSPLITLIDSVLDVTYSPVSIQYIADYVYLACLKTTRLSPEEIRDEVVYMNFPYNDPDAIYQEPIDHWRIIGADDSLPEFVSLSVDGSMMPHIAWERPPAETIFIAPLPPFDIYYAYLDWLNWSITNISNSPANSINPSLDWYGGHTYVVWQEKTDGYSVFLFKRNYNEYPPAEQTDTLSSAGNGFYPVTRMGGVVLWSDADSLEVYARVWDCFFQGWLPVENLSRTPDTSRYPIVEVWQGENGINIIGNWTEGNNNYGLGQRFVSGFPIMRGHEIFLPSYYLKLGDKASTPYTLHRDSTIANNHGSFDLGYDTLIYNLPCINKSARCRLRLELYCPGTRGQKDNGWKIKLDLDGVMQHILNLVPDELNIFDYDVPAVVNMDGKARIRLKRIDGDYILLKRVLFFEYERHYNLASTFSGGVQGEEASVISPFFSLNIYPNPTKGVLKIRFNSPDKRKVTIKLYDVSGRLVQQEDLLHSRVGMNEVLITPEGLSTGVYFVSVETMGYKKVEKVVLLK